MSTVMVIGRYADLHQEKNISGAVCGTGALVLGGMYVRGGNPSGMPCTIGQSQEESVQPDTQKVMKASLARHRRNRWCSGVNTPGANANMQQ